MLIYLFVIEHVLTSISALNSWTQYLPGQAQEALIGSTLANQPLLHPWQGGLVRRHRRSPTHGPPRHHLTDADIDNGQSTPVDGLRLETPPTEGLARRGRNLRFQRWSP